MRRRCCCNNTCQLHPSFTYVKDGLHVVFTNTTDSFYPITAHHWDFGDGSTSTAENPSHTYATTGTYVVTLTETNNIGCVRSTTQIIKFITIVPCEWCIGGVGPEEVTVRIPGGTSEYNCQYCINKAGIYILSATIPGSCVWRYSEILGICQNCITFPQFHTLRLDLTLSITSIIQNPSQLYLTLEVRFTQTTPGTTDDICFNGRVLYRKLLSSLPISCTTSVNLPISTFSNEWGDVLCLHDGGFADAFL